MAELMTIGSFQSGSLAGTAHDHVDTLGAQTLTAAGAFQGDKGSIGRCVHQTLAAQVVAHRGEEHVRDRRVPRTAALALGDEQRTIPDLDVAQTKPEDLATTQPTQRYGQDHRPISMGPHHGQEGVDLPGERIFDKVCGTRTSGTRRDLPPCRREQRPRGTGFVTTEVSPRAIT